MRENVIYIQGNHDRMFEYFVSEMGLDMSYFISTSEMIATHRMWLREGGIPTNDGFLNLSMEERQEIVEYIENAPVYDELEVNGKYYVLVHAGIQDYNSSKEMYEYEDVDFLEGRTDYSSPLFADPDYILVTGHTPAFYIRPDGKTEVYVAEGHIAVDCGAAYGGKLVAYCIETKECFYV